jgi:hypothetical protein
MSLAWSPFFSPSVCPVDPSEKDARILQVLLSFRVTRYRAPGGIIRLADWSPSSRQQLLAHQLHAQACYGVFRPRIVWTARSTGIYLRSYPITLATAPQGLTGVKDSSAPAQASGPVENTVIAAGKRRLFTALSVCPLREKRQRTIPLLVGERQQESSTGRLVLIPPADSDFVGSG